MLQRKVFDIDTDLAEFCEQSTKRTSGIRDKNVKHRVAGWRTAVLAGNARYSPITPVHDPMNCTNTSSFEGTTLGSGIEVVNKIIEIHANLAKNFNDRTGISRQNRSPQSRIRGRNACRVAKSLARQRKCRLRCIN